MSTQSIPGEYTMLTIIVAQYAYLKIGQFYIKILNIFQVTETQEN